MTNAPAYNVTGIQADCWQKKSDEEGPYESWSYGAGWHPAIVAPVADGWNAVELAPMHREPAERRFTDIAEAKAWAIRAAVKR